MNFGYEEHGERKNALVKLRLCPECSAKLNHHSKKRQIVKEKRQVKREDDAESSKSDKRRHSRREERRHQRRSQSRSPILPSTSDIREEATEATEVRSIDFNSHLYINFQAKQSKESVKPTEEIWAKKATVADAEQTLEDEFDEFIDDLLM